MSYRAIRILVFLAIFLVIGCSTRPIKYSGQTAVNRRSSSPTAVQTRVDKKWWENWDFGKGVEGESLVSLSIIEGDRAFSNGDRQSALTRYSSAVSQKLSPVDRAAVSYRLAALNLSVNQPRKSLEVLSSYCREMSLAPDMLSPKMGLLFGAAYREYGDIDQSLAWFSRAYESAKGSKVVRQIIEDEVEIGLSNISQDKLNEISDKWQNDLVIRVAVGKERARREAVGSDRGVVVAGSENQVESALSSSAPGASIKVGLLVPLSGKFANLGNRTRGGVELALQGRSNVELVVEDSGDSPLSASQAAINLVERNKVNVIIGPIISEQAQAVREVVDGSGIYQISLSKRSDFVPGGRVFRLGVTAESQVESLLEDARDVAGIKSIALVCSEDSALLEVCDLARRRASQLGVVVSSEIVNIRASNESALRVADQLSESIVDGVLFVDNSQVAADILAAIPESRRGTFRALGLGNWDNPSHIANGRTLLKGAIFVSPFFADKQRSTKSEFANSFKERFSDTADFFAAQGFDAASLIVGASERMASSSLPFDSALRSFDRYDGLTGVIYIGQDGELRRKFTVVTLADSGILELGNNPAQ